MDHPRALISWAHQDRRWDSERTAAWRESVVGFAETLLAHGIDAELDLWAPSRTDWTRRGQQLVVECDFVLIVISRAWSERWQGHNDPREGAGVVVEADTLKGLFTKNQDVFQNKCVIVLLPGVDAKDVPPDLERLRRVTVPEITPAGIEELVRVMTDQPEYLKPPLGALPRLPPRPRSAVLHADPPGTGAPDHLLEAVVSSSRQARSVVWPDIMPNMDRLAGLTDKLGAPVSRLRAPVVIVGDGGYGKSVLLGQVFDALVRDEKDSGARTLLLPCGRVPASADLSDLQSLDRALGNAAVDSRDSPALTGIVAALAANGRVRLLIDTLDLVLSEVNADDIAYLLRQLARHCELVITCREQEWGAYLGSDGEIARSLYRMPVLGVEEIGRWAEAYLRSSDLDVEKRRTFLASLVTDRNGRRVRDVCASPLRLAMACDIYAKSGGIPEDLTVTQLYEQYWERRIAQDRRGRGGAAATAQETAAEGLAAEVWAASTSRFVESVTGDLANSDPSALNSLLSDGVVTKTTGRYAFFHQTYAEFAVARLLVRTGDGEDLARLAADLRSTSSAYWPIAKHLLMMTMNADRYELMAEAVPCDAVEGVRAHFLGAFNRGSATLVKRVSERVWAQSPHTLLTSVSVLDKSPPECVGVTLDTLLKCAAAAETAKDLSGVGIAAASLILNSRPEEQARELRRVVTGIAAGPEKLGHAVVSSVISRLLSQTVKVSPSGPAMVRVLADEYPALPDAARAEVLSLVAAGSRDPVLDRSLLVKALRLPCPQGAVEHATAILIRSWEDAAFRSEVHWPGWTDMLEMDLPTRWDACQVLLAAELCRDEAAAQKLLGTVTGPANVARVRYTNAAKRIADANPEVIRRMLLSIGDGLTASALGSVCSVASHVAPLLPAGERQDLIAVLDRYASAEPRRVWPTTIKLCAGDIGLLRARAASLQGMVERAERGDAMVRTVLQSSFDGFLSLLSRRQVAEMKEELRVLCSDKAVDRVRRARLEGTIALCSAEARDWVESELLTGHGTKVVSAAARAVVEALPELAAAEPHSDAIPWLFGLLASPHSNAVRMVARGLAETAPLVPLPGRHGVTVSGHLVTWAQRDADAQVQSALLDLLIAVDQSSELDARVARSVVATYFDIVIDGLGPDSAPKRRAQLPALFLLYTKAVAAVGLRHLSHDQVTELVTEVVTRVDSGRIGGRSRRSLASLLETAGLRYPQVLSTLERLWTTTSSDNKYAIAECFARVETGTPGHRSLALARRPDCPPEAANHIHGKFGG
ncbi:toll/interleukin-1 receptor domain-containing protein [Streptomyces sp. AK02-01A]|uniref:toll/interleukin-1 receptor domain-containing protein n=1 Tax=Streptomyces sp. AK02-01A TaxID=3028648 RepID=UPI0029B97022|nr:toll/interleukin-1 receptor domain-containing protein [Streptomyces sp. AK02-01A]MDX3849589.1 toll/interleukin-1 receptor domain-containing protein [Streptomyces sp. AK02-01A]MDX3849841.1 toll/interleukin-1 receptor domain-containing protein [Streptomyces sp. AK02-01A]